MNMIQNITKHAEMANQVLNSMHTLCVTGKLDLTQGERWQYDWAVLEFLMGEIQKMQTVKSVRSPGGGFDGSWLRKEISIDGTVYGEDLKGILSVSRHGPSLEEIVWNWEPVA